MPAFSPHQHEVIGAAVGIVADHAAFHPHGGVLINVGPAFFDVALDAGLPVGGVQAGAIDAAVRVMTVRTLHQALRHAVVHRQGELGLDVAMAGKAQIRLGFLQQAAVQPAHCFRKLRHLKESRLGQDQAALALILTSFTRCAAWHSLQETPAAACCEWAKPSCCWLVM